MMMRRRSLWSLVSLLCIMVCATPAAICQTGPQAESVSDPGSYPVEANTIGINYGQVADNLPTPQEAVLLIQSMKIGRVKLFDSDPAVMTALANTGLQVISALPNDGISAVASSSTTAEQWVQDNVLAYYPATDITTIHVGNELWSQPGFQPLWDQLMPCILNIHASLTYHNLSQAIKVSTAVAFNALATSYPPSAGVFSEEIAVPYVQPLLQFLSETHSYFYINAYPYFAWASDPAQIPLEYTLFELDSSSSSSSSSTASTTSVTAAGVVLDGHLKYYNMLDAQLDAVNAAMEQLGYGDVRIAISETGWPTAGDPGQLGCNIPNAANYNRRLVTKMLSTSSSVLGTPSRPGIFIPTFIFALFNEDLKPGPGTERHWGLLYPNGTNVYSIDMTGQMGSFSFNSTSSSKAPNLTPASRNNPLNDLDPPPPPASSIFNEFPGFDISCGSSTMSSRSFKTTTTFTTVTAAFNLLLQQPANIPLTAARLLEFFFPLLLLPLTITAFLFLSIHLDSLQ
ncbi:unnamed protein product [Sphagnum jensenii]|uniref:Glucan endo-1,3-beta-D-glucosidase n=1 Tax=Sphagnum jensenii TaxID=128206 RepID=A0ABP1BM33_9BRYO